MCIVAMFANMLAYEIEKKVLEKAKSIFLECSMKMVGLNNLAPDCVPDTTTKATTQIAMLSLNIERQYKEWWLQ